MHASEKNSVSMVTHAMHDASLKTVCLLLLTGHHYSYAFWHTHGLPGKIFHILQPFLPLAGGVELPTHGALQPSDGFSSLPTADAECC
jgi:hypothetical protein